MSPNDHATIEKPQKSRQEVLADMLRARGRQQVREHPVSRGQQALWFLHQSAPNSAAYTVVFAMRILSQLDKPALQTALQNIVQRHPQLRATFHMSEGTLVQRIPGFVDMDLPEIDLTGCTREQVDQALSDAAATPFDLEHGPLFRPQLFRISDTEHALVLAVHHIVYDGWSLWLTLDELRANYAAQATGKIVKLSVPSATYIDHISAQEALISGPRGQDLEAYWQDRLTGLAGTLDLPTDMPRPPVRKLDGAAYSFSLGAPLSEALRKTCRDIGITPFSALIGAYQLLLNRYTGQDMIPVGTRSAGRGDTAMADVIGYFVNPIVIVGDIVPDQPVGDWLQTVQEQVLTAVANDDLPFPTIVEKLQNRRDPSTTPLFQASFVMQKAQRAGSAMELMASQASGKPVEWAGLQVEYIDLPQQVGQFDIDLEMFEVGDSFEGVLKYDTALFLQDTIERFADDLRHLLSSIVDDPQKSIDDLDAVNPKALEWIANTAKPQSKAIAAELCVHEQFERRASETPDAPALIFEGQTISYGELNARANQLAHALIAQGVLSGDLVGLCSERSIEMVVGIIGILKAGAAYLPLDPSLPEDRLNYIMNDSAAQTFVCQPDHRALGEDANAKIIEIQPGGFCDGDWATENPDGLASLDGLIYVMYTSGTTGRPKGVQLTHRNVARLFLNTAHWYNFNDQDVWALFHSFAFDVSVWELWGALTHGGRIVVVPYLITRSPAQFVELVFEQGVTVLNQSPSAFKLFVPEEAQNPLPSNMPIRLIIFAGEPLDLQSLKPWVARHGDQTPALINMYGITETTVHAMYRRVFLDDLDRAKSTIGVTIPDLQIDLLDHRLRPVPVGTAGEIHVSGPGVSMGYLNREELTSEKFVTGENGTLYYKSSDLARYLPDGDIEYLGRNDKQVKIRGFRIELGEIEASLCNHSGVQTAVVVPQEHPQQGRRLVAYTVPEDQDVAEKDLRTHLAAVLPDYMIPSAFVTIDAIPLTGNGKLNHAMLPEPVTQRSEDNIVIPARDALEAKLIEIWEDILDMSPIGIRDDFFQLGGHSLLAVHAMTQTGAAYGRKFATAALFRNPTIEQFAELIRNGAEDSWSPIVPMNSSEQTQTPFFCIAGGGGSTLYFQSLAAHMPTVPFMGVQLRGTDGQHEPHETVEAAAAETIDAIRSTQPEGPYRLGGHCFGGLVAYEVARRLQAAGETVERLIILDAPAPLSRMKGLNQIEDVVPDQAEWLAKIAEILAESAGQRLLLSPEDIRNAENAFGYVSEKLSDTGLLPADSAREYLQGFFKVFVANSRVRYSGYTRLNTDITLLRAGDYHADYDYSTAEDPGLTAEQSVLGWHHFTTRKARYESVAGNHLTMLTADRCPALAERVMAALA